LSSFFECIFQKRVELNSGGEENTSANTQVNANADLDSLTLRFAVEAREAMQAHLASLFSREDEEIEQQEASGGSADTPSVEATSTEVIACPVPTSLPVVLSAPDREELAAEIAARHDWIAEQGKPQVLVTPSKVMDNQPMRDLLFRTRFRWKLRPRHVTGDAKYGTIQNIKAIEDTGIRAHVPLPDWEHMTLFYGPSKFSYDAEHDQYLCPQGKPLLPFHISTAWALVRPSTGLLASQARPLRHSVTESRVPCHPQSAPKPVVFGWAV
jgi:hypothetical protein